MDPLHAARIHREVRVPDTVRLERQRHAPELGVRPVFFSGGSALRRFSRRLIEYTHNSVHLITPFDSGGSSAVLRKHFRMPAVGDLRNRLMALADRSVLGSPEVVRLFSYRFPTDETPALLANRMEAMVRGTDPRIRTVPEPLRDIVRSHLRSFASARPESFDLRGAAIGNLVLAGGYLEHGRQLDPVLYLFSSLVQARGRVRPVVDRSLHLVADLEDGSRIVGQHLIAAEGTAPPSPVASVWLSRSRARPVPIRPEISRSVADLIRSADLICYPVGSFYTSVIASLLPAGVADTIAATPVPKIYIANPAGDPEESGLSLEGKVRTLLGYLQVGAEEAPAVDQVLNVVLVDRTVVDVAAREIRAIERLGVQVMDVPLATPESTPRYGASAMVEALLSFT